MKNNKSPGKILSPNQEIVMNFVFSLLLLVPSAPLERQLSVKNIPASQRQNYLNAASFVLNSLSANHRIVKPKLKGDYIRFDLNDYGISAKVYDNLACPYTEKRADWFIVNALAKNYNKLLLINSLKDYEKLVFLDVKMATQVGGVCGLVINNGSKVANCSQLVTRYISYTGSVWEFSYNHDLRSFFNHFSKDDRLFIGNLPNGLFAYLLLDTNNKILTYGNPKFLIDARNESDRLFYAARSSIVCNLDNLDFKDHVRALLKNNISLITDCRKTYRELQDLFGRDIDSLIKEDRKRYNRALKKTNGLTPQKNADLILKICEEYNKMVSVEVAAKELDLSVEELKKMCKKSNCIYLLGLFLDKPMRRDVWEKKYKELYKAEIVIGK